ncbi:4-hydroxybenzoate 3-monooxygenase [Amycolatopsis ultiminotia]|uniref:4-hydroxybenzoate 3-monooxygenase n=1 Tax=Amycolatopsis ultiminotia TaxID=543629 RepID=UPI0031E64856
MAGVEVPVVVAGAGPSGLVLASILHEAGIPVVVLERASREHVEQRARAGLVEYRTVCTLREHGLADGLLRSATTHRRCEFRYAGERFTLDYGRFTGERMHYVYPQQLLVRDLLTGLLDRGGDVRFETPVTEVTGLTGDHAMVRFVDRDGTAGSVRTSFVAGCDGDLGACRKAVPAEKLPMVTKDYRTNLLAVLSATRPLDRDMVYALHPDGCAIHALRTSETSRYYLQVDRADRPADWSEQRIWAELGGRFAVADGPMPRPGPILETGLLAMRTAVTEHPRYGRLFLVGDAAHIITPFGGKGMNLAIADAADLAAALVAAIRSGDETGLAEYPAGVRRRTWATQEFSHGMIDLLCRPDGQDREFRHRVQCARLAKWQQSPADAAGFARDYVG